VRQFGSSRKARRIGRRGTSLLEVALGALVMAGGILIFAAFYPTAARCSRMSGSYSQAISEVQHKIDQLRAIGYGRLNYSEMTAAGIIDPTPTSSPYRFEKVDDLKQVLWDPIGTIQITPAGANLAQATITLSWRRTAGSSERSTHAVTILITNE
jgi:hypothetical protein